MTKQEVKELGYNEVQYTAYPFEYTKPENLKTIGTLFGVNAKDIENARVLEIGCSDGGNILRFAELYPKSYTLGIDLSPVQINSAQKKLDKLKLKNIEFKAMSVTDLDESFGKFDYIICHGVFSWVPDFVRDAILENGKKLLDKNGLFFISYNTLPGWNMNNSIRELMLYHSANFDKAEDKIIQSRAILKFIQESLEGHETSHAEFLQSSAKNIDQKEDYYIFHEYLEENNKALYFNEFINHANSKGLGYVGDTDAHRMYTGNLPQKAMEKLSAISDIVRTEQYIDFINNTEFRCTVLTHQDVVVSRNITDKTIEKLFYYGKIIPQGEKINFQDNSNVKFSLDEQNTRSVDSSSPEMKSILLTLSQNEGNPLSVDEIAEGALKLLPKSSKQVIKQTIINNFARLIFSGIIKYTSEKPKSIFKISNKPKITSYAAMQIAQPASNGYYWMTNCMNQLIAFHNHHAFIVQHIDGKRTIEEIKTKTFEDIKNNKITANEDGKPITDEAQMKLIADALVDQTLEILKNNYSLIA